MTAIYHWIWDNPLTAFGIWWVALLITGCAYGFYLKHKEGKA